MRHWPDVVAVAIGAGFLRLVWWPAVRQSKKEARDLERRTDNVKAGIIRMSSELLQARAEIAILTAERDELRVKLSSSSS